MTNEEIIENTHTGFFTIVEAMDAARKDEREVIGFVRYAIAKAEGSNSH